MSSSVQMTNIALNELEELLKIPSLDDQPVEYFAGRILGAWVRAENELQNLDERGGVELERFGDRLLGARTKLQAVITSRIDEAIIDVEENGNKVETLEWLAVARGVNLLVGNEQKRLELARDHFRKYDKARKDYITTIEKLEVGKKDIDKGNFNASSLLKHAAEKTLEYLRETKSEFETFASKDDFRLIDLRTMCDEIEKAYEPFLLQRSIIDSVVRSSEFEEAWKYLSRAADLNLPVVTYFTNPNNLEDLDKDTISTKDALKNCESRWKIFSRTKFWEYIESYKVQIKDSERNLFFEDPRNILNEFEKRTQRVLRPVDELDADTKNKFDQFMGVLRSAIILTEKIAGQLDAIDIVNARLGSLHELDSLESELKEETPFLIDNWNQKREELIKNINQDQTAKLMALKVQFEIDVKRTGQEAAKYVEQLRGVIEFKEFESAFQKIVKLSIDLGRNMDRLEKLDPENADKEIDDLLQMLEEYPDLPKPRQLLSLREQIKLILEPASQSSQLIEQIEEISQTYASRINQEEDLANWADILFEIQDWEIRLQQVHDALNIINDSGKPFPGAKKILKRLEVAQLCLAEIESWAKLYGELQKPGADLSEARKQAENLENTNRQLIDQDRVDNLLERFWRLGTGDQQVAPIITSVLETLRTDADLETLLDLWKKLNGTMDMPTTFAADRNKAKSELRGRLLQACVSFLHDFEDEPRRPSLTLAKRALGWVQSDAGQMLPQDFISGLNAALQEAYAWNAFQNGKFAEAQSYWLQSENTQRPNARLHRLALLKFMALFYSKQFEHQYLRRALGEKELKSDVELCALSTQLVLDQIDQYFQDVFAIREGNKIVDFEKASLGLANLVSWSDEQQNDQSNGSDDGFDGRFAEVWNSDGYPQMLKENNIEFPSAHLVIQEARYRPAVYNSLSAVFQRVSKTASLSDLDLARRSADHLIAQKQWFVVAQQLLEQEPELKKLFESKWKVYRKMTIESL